MALHEKHTRGIALALAAACTLALPLCASASEASVDIETTTGGTGTATVYIETETNGQKHAETYTSQKGSIGVSVEATSSGYTTRVWGADAGNATEKESASRSDTRKAAPNASSSATSTPQQAVQISGSEQVSPSKLNFMEQAASWFLSLLHFFIR